MGKKQLVTAILLSLIPIAAFANDEAYRSDQDQEMLRIQRERQNQGSDGGESNQDAYKSPPPKDPRACRLFGAFNSSLCDTEDETE